MPQPVMYRLDQLDIFQISPFEYAKQLIHYTYACVVSKININKIFIEAASLSNPRLVDFNIFNVKDQTTVLKLAQGKYSGIAGIELVAESTYKKKKKDEKKGNIEPITSAPIRDCFVAKRAIEWFMQTLYCSLNGAVDWFRHFRSQGDFIPLDDTLKGTSITFSCTSFLLICFFDLFF